MSYRSSKLSCDVQRVNSRIYHTRVDLALWYFRVDGSTTVGTLKSLLVADVSAMR